MGVDESFSIVALFIIFRETVEASIIVSVLLQFLSRSFPHLKKQVWWGVAMGILVSIMFGVIFSVLFYVAKNNMFTGESKAIFKGCIAWFAGTLITFLAFAMLRYKGWEEKIKRKLEALAQKELEKEARGDVEEPPAPTWPGRVKQRSSKCMSACTRPIANAFCACFASVDAAVCACWGKTTGGCRAAGQCLPCVSWRPSEPTKQVSDLEGVGENAELAVTKEHGWGIFLIVFSTVVREGVESVVFLAGVGNAQPSSLPLPGAVGFICGILVGVFLYYTGRQVKDIKWFIIIMAIVLFFIAGGQFMLGADFLTTGGMFGYCSIWINERPAYMQPLWNFSGCCPDDDSNKFFALSRAIFGYQDQPTTIEITVYCVYWGVVIGLAIWKYFTGSLFDADYKHKRMMAKVEKEMAARDAAMAQQLELAGDVPLPKKLAIEYEPSKDMGSIAGSSLELNSATGSKSPSPPQSGSPSAADPGAIVDIQMQAPQPQATMQAPQPHKQ